MSRKSILYIVLAVLIVIAVVLAIVLSDNAEEQDNAQEGNDSDNTGSIIKEHEDTSSGSTISSPIVREREK